MPRLEACYFDGHGAFAGMVRVLEMTAAVHCQDWQRSVSRITPTPRTSAIGLAIHVQNVQKVERWAEIVRQAPEGEQLLLMDADTAIVRPLDDIWAESFDLAYTTKRRPFPFNLGVLFLRVSESMRTFFAGWLEENLQLLQDVKGPGIWRQKYGGINQASFGALLERGALAGLKVRTLPCAEWNCEESGWAKFDPSRTRILHIKGALRRALLRHETVTPEIARAAEYYRSLERQLHQRVA